MVEKLTLPPVLAVNAAAGPVLREWPSGEPGRPGYPIAVEHRDGIHLSLDHPTERHGRVAYLSPLAVWFEPSAGLERFAGGREIECHLHFRETSIGPLSGQLIGPDEARPHTTAGIRFRGMPQVMGRQLLEVLDEAVKSGAALAPAEAASVQENITDPLRIRDIFAALAAVRARGIVRSDQCGVPIVLERFDAEASLIVWNRVGAALHQWVNS